MHLSLITPKKGYTDLEKVLNDVSHTYRGYTWDTNSLLQVNEGQVEIHTVTNTVMDQHIVKLAGFKLHIENPLPIAVPGIEKTGK